MIMAIYPHFLTKGHYFAFFLAVSINLRDYIQGMSKEEIENIIKRYLSGTATPEEKCQVDKWYAALGDKKDDLFLPGSSALNEALASGFSALTVKLAQMGDLT
jgi:hypothetical protein